MNRYNVRVYGILINNRDEVLLSQEWYGDDYFVKFPGGGHQFGEGLAETIIREFKEELNLDVSVDQLYYVNDFAQESAYNPNDQLVSVYYVVSSDSWTELKTFLIEKLKFKGERASWVSLKNLNRNLVRFPIDKVVVDLLTKSKL